MKSHLDSDDARRAQRIEQDPKAVVQSKHSEKTIMISNETATDRKKAQGNLKKNDIWITICVEQMI